MRIEQQTQVARKYLGKGQPKFVVCKALNYKCLKQKNPSKKGSPCEVIPGVKVPNKFTSRFSRMFDSSNKDPRRGPQVGRLMEGAGMYVYDRRRTSERVADMQDRDPVTVHTGYKYPHGITKNDGDGLGGMTYVEKYSPTSDPVG